MAWTLQFVVLRVVTTYTVVHGHPIFFRVKVNSVKNMVKLSHTTKRRWSINSTKRGRGSTTQSKSIQKWMGNLKNQETIWFSSWSKYQNGMTWNRMGQHIALKWWHLSARVYGITTDDPSLGLTQMNIGYTGCKKGSEIYLYITANSQSYCHSVVTSIIPVSCVGR